MSEVKGRFAPTPSGNMHVGNSFCYLLAWLSAKQQGGRIVLRMEDADLPRMRKSAVLQTLSDLEWLGLEWDEGPGPQQDGGLYYQSCRTEIYDRFFASLREKGTVYPCFCSRKDILLAAAPHAEDCTPVYPGTCWNLSSEKAVQRMKTQKPAWRLHLEPETITIHDRLFGRLSWDVQAECGDFPIRRTDGIYCYQFTTALDDVLMHISEVVRSNDLLASTPWQIYIQHLFGYQEPDYIHIPMLLDESGQRMAKRSVSLSICEIRKHYTPKEVLGRLAFLANLQSDWSPCTLEQLLSVFSWDRLPKQNIVIPKALFAKCQRETSQ
ncbi:MAG: tRNA glutamyl-Q(34) synthetase GluQRS [Oscillibacter sp.]|nr:tRNA glutamyl-Q(34) synthetase GluQRS [Oscillibacter sp.]